MLIPARALVHKISPNLAPHHAAFVEPLSCSLHAVERANIQFNDTVVVACVHVLWDCIRRRLRPLTFHLASHS